MLYNGVVNNVYSKGCLCFQNQSRSKTWKCPKQDFIFRWRSGLVIKYMSSFTLDAYRKMWASFTFPNSETWFYSFILNQTWSDGFILSRYLETSNICLSLCYHFGFGDSRLISIATSYYSSWGNKRINAIQTIYCLKCWSTSICLQHQAAVTGYPLTYTWKRLSLRDSLNSTNLLRLFHEKEETLTPDQKDDWGQDKPGIL